MTINRFLSQILRDIKILVREYDVELRFDVRNKMALNQKLGKSFKGN